MTTPGRTAGYSYDYEDRLADIGYPSTATNAFDTRVSKADSAGTATLMRDGVGVCSPVLSDGSSSFTPGVSQRSGATSTFQAMDRLGTFKVETNASQSVTGTRTYDAFGNPTGTTGTPTTPFGFAAAWGYQQDPDSGLQLLGRRYYDPTTGRFLTRDPAKDGRNWYGYCANNPTSRVDPTGNMIGVLAAILLLPTPVGSPDYMPPLPHGVDPHKVVKIVKMQLVNFQDDNDNDPWGSIPGYGIKNGIDYSIRKLEWYRYVVNDGGPWDIKQRPGGNWEPAGNWLYGVSGTAAGFSDGVLLRMAGRNQMGKTWYNSDDGKWWLWPPYGDDPNDQFWIQKGIQWYHAHYTE